MSFPVAARSFVDPFARVFPDKEHSLHESRWIDRGDGLLRFEIQASSFCQQMVRSIVGLMIEVGMGKRTAGDVMTLLQSRDRSTSSPLAPAAGLYLWEVEYADRFGRG